MIINSRVWLTTNLFITCFAQLITIIIILN